MDLLSKSDEEIYEIARPFWENLVKSSNLKDYGGFTRDFSTQMLFGANEVELGKQWANNKLILDFKGATKSKGVKNYFKFGIYRSKVSIYKQIQKKDIPIQVVYFDEVRAGKKKEDVIKNLK